jgi:hypothetical protein
MKGGKEKMEKQKATFKAFSNKTGGICLDMGEGQAWFTPTEKVLNFVPKLKKGSEVLVTLDEENYISFIKPLGIQESENNGKGNVNGIEKVSALKNHANKRMSALNNATSLVVAKGGDALDEVKVLEIAEKYLDFLEKAE